MQALKMVISYKLICLILMLIGLIAQLTKTKPTQRDDLACEPSDGVPGRPLRNHTTNRIIDGWEAEENEYRDFVVVGIYKSKEDKSFTCGGVLLEKLLVLTAAHCLDDVTDAKHVTVLNTHKRKSEWSLQEQNRAVPAAKICKHSSHWEIDEKNWYDYAIITLTRPLINYKLGEIADDFVTEDDTVTAVGLGISHYVPENWTLCEAPYTLKKLNMELVECDEYNSGNTHICFTSEEGGDVCFGDSGAPVYDEDGKVVAITSYGDVDSMCIHNHKAKSVFADVVDNKDEIVNLMNRCRPPEESDPEDWLDELI